MAAYRQWPCRLPQYKRMNTAMAQPMLLPARQSPLGTTKSGPEQGPISANLFRTFLVKLPQNRHPERSASQIYHLTKRSVARSRRTSAAPILTMVLGAFQPPKPENRILLQYALDGHGNIFSCTLIIFYPQVCARPDLARCWQVPGSRPRKDRGGSTRCGLRWLKSSEHHS